MKDDVCIRDLEKDFGGFKAVNKLSLRVKHGEIYGLLGPNGAGKTTVIKILCGLLRPSSGEAYVLDMKVPDPRTASRIGYMPQELAMYRGLTVHENLAFYGEVFGLSKQRIDTREQALLKLIDLQAFRDTLVDQLSGGMQQRTSLACALLHEPQLLFLDEPTVGVDPDLRASFWQYFEELRDSGITILITTHYMDEARHCDRIGFMREGRLIAEGSPQELLELTHTDSLEDAFLSYSRTGGST
ncbi:MAG: ABC transporter ATP-binding protein [Halobacteriota archaeon]